MGVKVRGAQTFAHLIVYCKDRGRKRRIVAWIRNRYHGDLVFLPRGRGSNRRPIVSGLLRCRRTETTRTRRSRAPKPRPLRCHSLTASGSSYLCVCANSPRVPICSSQNGILYRGPLPVSRGNSAARLVCYIKYSWQQERGARRCL